MIICHLACATRTVTKSSFLLLRRSDPYRMAAVSSELNETVCVIDSFVESRLALLAIKTRLKSAEG